MEKKTTKKAAAAEVVAVETEKKTTKKAAAAEVVAVETEKKTTKKACCAKKAAAVVLNAEIAGFRAGNIYQALDAAQTALTVKELVKATQATEQEILLGMGWLLREGKLTVCEDKVALA